MDIADIRRTRVIPGHSTERAEDVVVHRAEEKHTRGRVSKTVIHGLNEITI
jgi:hypothetical protein